MIPITREQANGTSDDDVTPEQARYAIQIIEEMAAGAVYRPLEKRCSTDVPHIGNLAILDVTLQAKVEDHPWPPEDENAIPIEVCRACVMSLPVNGYKTYGHWIWGDQLGWVASAAKAKQWRLRWFGDYWWIGANLTPDLPE